MSPRKSSVLSHAAYNTLGWGFLERVYQAAMEIELRKKRLTRDPVSSPIKVLYEGVCIGIYFADLLVEGCVIVEIKAVERFAKLHQAQLLNYLKATTIDVGLLMNFGLKPEFRHKTSLRLLARNPEKLTNSTANRVSHPR